MSLTESTRPVKSRCTSCGKPSARAPWCDACEHDQAFAGEPLVEVLPCPTCGEYNPVRECPTCGEDREVQLVPDSPVAEQRRDLAELDYRTALRDRYAAAALQGLLANPAHVETGPSTLARFAWQAADALLAAR